MGRRIFRNWLEPELPEHLRDEFTVLAAEHMRGQSRLLFTGFILSLPMVVAARVEAAPLWVGIGLPVVILLFSLAGIWAVRVAPREPRVAMSLIQRAWLACFGAAAAGSLWCVMSWAYAPPDIGIYYVAIMSIGALTLGYTLTATRIVGVTALVVTLVPISLALLATGELLPSTLAVGFLIAVVFQALLIGRHQSLLVELVEERNHSRELARIDPLTGIANRRSLLESASRLAHGQAPIRLMILDLDRFKLVNDRYGHDTGDEVLMITASLLSRHASRSITVARVGGEEFALVGKEEHLSVQLANTILEEIRTAEMPHGEPLTASIGMATGTLAQPGGWSDLYGEADRALYAAKADGKNRVRAFAHADTHDPVNLKRTGASPS